MQTERCEDCLEVKKLGFQIDGLGIVLQKQNIRIDGVQQVQESRDIEHEQMIQNLTTRMDTMSQEFIDFKKEVKDDIKSIKEEIPEMFDSAVNKLLAKMLKYLLIAIGGLIVVIVLSFTRPLILKGIDNFKIWVETCEVSK